MIKLNKEHLIFFDCDETLILHNKKNNTNIRIIDPYNSNGPSIIVKEHSAHVKLLKDHFVRGYGIVVWSAAGREWSEAVVKALGLEQYVDIVMSKPTKYVDDLEAHQILGSRVFLRSNN